MSGIGKLVRTLANMTYDPPDDWLKELAKMGQDIGEVCKEAVVEGAQPMADEIRNQIESLPEDNYRYLRGNDMFVGVTKEQKEDLLEGLGITHVDIDYNGNYNVKVGFDGYGIGKSKAYPKGLPIPLLARAIESGSSVRVKIPFIKTAIKKKKKTVLGTITTKITTSLEKYRV